MHRSRLWLLLFVGNSLKLCAALVLCAAFLPEASGGIPPLTSERLSNTRSSLYRDGYQVNGSGQAYTFFQDKLPDGTWSNSLHELRQDPADVINLLSTGDHRLMGFNNLAQPQYYTGTSTNLAAHYAGYSWQVKNLMDFDGQDVTANVQVQVNWSQTTLTPLQQAAKTSEWESNIEGWLNDQYVIVRNQGQADEMIFPVAVNLAFDGYHNVFGGVYYDYQLVARPGSGRANMANWYLTDNAAVVTHEFLHMIDNYDEYWTGAINSSNPALPTDYAHLMGRTTFAWRTALKPLYYEPMLNWLTAIDPDTSASYVLRAVPLPSTLLLTSFGLIQMHLFGRLRRKRV
jgi:hypothetical protein